MTHVILQEQGATNDKSVMCVERESHTAIILQADFDKLDQLVTIATAMKVPTVSLIVDAPSVEVFEEAGWTRSEKVLMEKAANGK